MLWDNLERRMNAAARLLKHARTPAIGNTAKSSYYRSATILLCTVVEGLVYEVVKKNTKAPDHIFYSAKKHVDKHTIPASIFNNATDIFICEKKDENLSINSAGADFGKFNIYLKNKSIVSTKEYNLLEKVRRERNKVHLQGLETPDTGYTNVKIEKIADVIRFLIPKL